MISMVNIFVSAVVLAPQNNVCVLGLSQRSLATGSTGVEVEGRLVGQQIRLWYGNPPKASELGV